MSYTTEGLLLYSKYTDNPIGTAIVEPAKVALTTSTYIEFAQFVTFQIDSSEEKRTKFVRWRKPTVGQCWWQFNQIRNNHTGLVIVDFLHINSGIAGINSVRRAKIGGSIVNGQLQPAGGALSILVQKNNIDGYDIHISGGNNNSFNFNFNPDLLTEENANEVDFTIE